MDDQFIKVSAYRKTDIEAHTKELREKYGNRLKMTISGDMWLDCMATGVNKGAAVKLLQESLEIAPEETIAFGDQLNDIEMLGRAYYSFAIGNARSEVKAATRFQDRYECAGWCAENSEAAGIRKGFKYMERNWYAPTAGNHLRLMKKVTRPSRSRCGTRSLRKN